MKQQHGAYDTKKYNKGINSDTNKELMGISDDGSHVDALNMRSLSQDGTNLGKKHIGGEGTIFPALDNKYDINNPIAISDFTPYHCMMTQSINGKIVEIWCSENNTTLNPSKTEPSFIRVDGVIYLMSFDYPVYYDKPLQYDKNQHVLGGEFYTTDFYSEPMIFNVQDLIDASDSASPNFNPTKYFSDFNYNQYTVTIQSSLYKPQFIDLVDSTPTGATVIGSGGLPVGQYSYSYRYVSSGGDFSSLAPLSDLIPVVIKVIKDRPTFGHAAVSAVPNIATLSSYNPYLKIRYVNDNNFASIQIIRHEWNTGAALDTQPISYVIHTEDISKISGMGVFSFVDAQHDKTAMTALTYEEANTDVTSIEAAKSIRFYNRRLYLMNLKYKSKVIDSVLNLDANKNYIDPTVQKMYHDGHSNVFNAACYKSYMRGEKQGFGVLLYDNNGAPTYVTPLPTGHPKNSYWHPNRRDVLSADAKSTSYEGVVTAITNLDMNGTEGLTYEVFDHERAVSRGGELHYDVLHSGVLHPTNENDLTFNFERPNVAVNIGGDDVNYDPRGFNLDYYSLGIAVKDIKIPAGYSGFSIVKTEPAKRVLAQGIAMYDFTGSNSINVYFPDFEFLNPTEAINFENNYSSSYKIEIISPLGFFTEIYSAYSANQDSSAPFYGQTGIDMLTFARILKENGNINPNTTGSVKYNSWINTSSAGINTLNNTTFTITNLINKTDDVNYFNLTLHNPNNTIYSTNPALHGTTPMYVVNLIKDNADVSEASTIEYTSTGHFQKAESIIGKISGTTTQSFSLISERWEDCINQPLNTSDNAFNAFAGLDKYIYVRNGNLDHAWINVTYKSTSAINNILNDIAIKGFYQVGSSPKVYGIYTDNSLSFTESLQRDYSIIFTAPNIPAINSEIIVKYDDRIPSRVFGGDTFINECIWAFKNNSFPNGLSHPSSDNSFTIANPFPFLTYKRSNGAAVILDSGSMSNDLHTNYWGFDIGQGFTPFIRQFINIYTAETRSPLCFSFEANLSSLDDLEKFYPLKNYVPRPYSWSGTTNIDPNYATYYGAEHNYWNKGGFKFKPTINQDNANRNNARLLTSVPKLGFTEQTNYPTRIAWSDKKAVNQQNTPSTKTFYNKSIWDISDNNGEIKFAWSAHSGGNGSNLYAFTSNGIALVLVDKRIINDANAQELFSGSAVDEGVVNELWLNQSIGMNDEFWRSWAEYNNILFFCNQTGVYAFTANQLEFLSEQHGFQEIYRKRVLPQIGAGVSTKLSGVFNILNKEYIMNFDISNVDPNDPQKGLIPSCLIYGIEQQALQCRASYDYDKYLALYNKLYGMKKGVTYELGVGNSIDGIAMVASVAGVSSGDKTRYEADPIYMSKEFIRIRVNSNHKPNRILFFDNYENYINGVVSSVVDSDAISYAIKDYGGYECYIPRKSLAPHLRQQGRLVIFRIENDVNEDFTVNATMVQFKLLK